MVEDKVIVATVTYNSSHFLRRLVEAVAVQKYHVEKIIAVDNASTEKHKSAIVALAAEFPILEVVTSSENLGGAGGFEKGVQYILDKGYIFDWIWIMDDDAFPREDCLERLLKHKTLKQVGALIPMIYGVDLQKFQFYHHKRVSKYLDADIRVGNSLEDFDDITEIETNAFVGPLVKRDAILNVGIPNGSLFIYGDDTEYMYRISRKYKLYLIKDAVMNHRDVQENSSTIHPGRFWKEYYKYRNRLLFIAEFQENRWKRLCGQMLVIKAILRETISTLRHRVYRGYRILRVSCMFRAISDGLMLKSGKTIDPSEFLKQVEQRRK